MKVNFRSIYSSNTLVLRHAENSSVTKSFDSSQSTQDINSLFIEHRSISLQLLVHPFHCKPDLNSYNSIESTYIAFKQNEQLGNITKGGKACHQHFLLQQCFQRYTFSVFGKGLTLYHTIPNFNDPQEETL